LLLRSPWLQEFDKNWRKARDALLYQLPKAFSEDGSVPEDGFRFLIEEAKKAAQVDRQISVSDVADLSILREVQRALEINAK
jgi:hypothetical protein